MNEEHSQRLQRPAPMMDCASDVVSKPEPPERDVGLNMKLSPFGRDIPFMKMPPCLPRKFLECWLPALEAQRWIAATPGGGPAVRAPRHTT